MGYKKILIFMGLLLIGTSSFAGNLHLIESYDNGFSIYRTGKPSSLNMEEFCKLGIQEMMVLSGDAEKYEYKYQKSCPTLKVIYNKSQSANIPVTKEFLNQFDQWVTDAQQQGKKIAFRCSCGCHRTGRLAAYYQMKYQNITPEDALAVMDKYGNNMWLHQNLKPQTYALYSFIKNESCSVEPKYCVKDE